MYLDYVVSAPNGSNHVEINKILLDLSKVFDGTITDKADFDTSVCNISLSEFVGTLPAEFDTTSVTYTAATNANESTVLKFTKSHAEANATFDYKKQIGIYWEHGDYGLRMCLENPTEVGGAELGNAGSNRAPMNGDIAIRHAHGGTNGSTTDMIDEADVTERIRIYITKSYVVIQGTRGIGNQAYTFGVFDKDVNAFDEAAYTLNSKYAPMMYMSDINSDFADPNNDNFYSINNNIAAGVLGFMGMDGTYYDQPSRYYQDNANVTHEIFYPYESYQDTSAPYVEIVTFLPAPALSFGKGIISGVDTHVVMPVFAYCPASPNTTTNVNDAPQFYGQLPRFYRTTNNIAAPGTTITQDGIDYVVLTWHKTGGRTYNGQSYEDACYLVPKTAGDS